MRILPPPFDELHPAFQVYPGGNSPQSATGLILWSPGVVGLGLLFLTLGRARSVGVRAFAFESTAYGALAIGAGHIYMERQRREIHHVFSEANGIKIPKSKLVDRLDHFDYDNAAIFGGMAGVLVALRARRPWSITGWKRWLGAANMGSAVACITLTANELVRYAQLGPSEHEALQRAGIEAMRWEVVIGKTLIALNEKKLLTAGIPLPEVVIPGTIDIQAKNTGRDKIGTDHSSWPTSSQEPHLTSIIDGEDEPIPFTNTNYTWAASVDHVVPELEAYIIKLRQRRQKLALEAELLWNLLATKEADFYSLSTSNALVNSDAIIGARRYVETLGNVHAKVWVEVSRCDWMIADARKRIQQHESSRATEEPKNAPAAPLQSPVVQTPSNMALFWLNPMLKQIEARRVALLYMKTQLEAELARKELVGVNLATEQVTTSGGRRTTVKQVVDEQMRKFDDDIDTAKFDAEVVGRVIDDCEKLLSGN